MTISDDKEIFRIKCPCKNNPVRFYKKRFWLVPREYQLIFKDRLLFTL
jgi:hypothetical protein